MEQNAGAERLRNQTDGWRWRVEVTEEVGELKKLIEEMKGKVFSWKDYFSSHMNDAGLSKYADMARLIGITQKTVENWLNGTNKPKTREMYMRIALACKMDKVETDYMLRRYGRMPGLYVRNLYDAICYYALCCRLSDVSQVQQYGACPYDRHVEKLLPLVSEKGARGAMSYAYTHQVTGDFEELIRNCGSDDAFIKLLRDRNGKKVHHEMPDDKQEKDLKAVMGQPVNRMVEAGMLPASFNTQISNLRNRGERLERDKLIRLCIATDLTVEMTDLMLVDFGYEKLNASDPVEMALIFGIRAAHLNDPSLEYGTALGLREGLKRARATNQALITECESIIAFHEHTNWTHMCEQNEYEGVMDYVKQVLCELKMADGIIKKYCT